MHSGTPAQARYRLMYTPGARPGAAALQVCAYRCIVSYESALLQDFSLCILQKHNCLGKDARAPAILPSSHAALCREHATLCLPGIALLCQNDRGCCLVMSPAYIDA